MWQIRINVGLPNKGKSYDLHISKSISSSFTLRKKKNKTKKEPPETQKRRHWYLKTVSPMTDIHHNVAVEKV